MPTNYTGDPTATQSPSPQPGASQVPIASLPADGDDLDAASVAQDFKTLADFVAFLTTNPLTKFEINWNAGSYAEMTVFGLTAATATGGGGSPGSSPDAIYMAPRASLTVTSTNGSLSRVYTDPPLIFCDPDLDFVIEIDFAYGSVSPVSSEAGALIGLVDSDAEWNLTTDDFFGFQKKINDATWWRTARSGVTLTEADTAVNITQNSSAFQRLRLEYHGSATSIGAGSNRVLWFIDNVAVGNVATSMPTGSAMYLAIQLKQGAGSGAGDDVSIGRVFASWNAQP